MIEPRIKEIFELAKIEVEKNDFKEDYTFGIILTGGGSKLNGIVNMAHEIFQMPIRIGEPIIDFEYNKDNAIDISSPRYATAIGLIKYAGKNLKNYNDLDNNSLINKVRNFFKNIVK